MNLPPHIGLQTHGDGENVFYRDVQVKELGDDVTAPTSTITVTPATPNGQAGWYTSRPTFTLAATDNAGGSGVASTEYRIAGGAWTPYTGTAVSVPGQGSVVIDYRSTDKATPANQETFKSTTVKIDTVAPAVTATQAGDTTKTVTVTATDATSGVASIQYQVDTDTTWKTYSAPLTFDAPGTYAVRYRATDNAGNVTNGQTEVVVPKPVETAKPTVSVTTTPAAANGRSNWFTSPVTVTLAGAGGEGKLSVEYRIGNGVWTAYTAPFQVTDDGVTVVQARATDAAGKTSAVETLTVKKDATSPKVIVTGIRDGKKLTVADVRTARVSAEDSTSGVAEQVITLDGEVVTSPVDLDALLLLSGKHRLKVTVLDVAGNTSSENIQFKIIATYGGGKQLVNRLDDEGTVGPKLAKKLVKQLTIAKRFQMNDKERQAKKALNRFKKLAVRGVDDRDAKVALKDLANELKKRAGVNILPVGLDQLKG